MAMVLLVAILLMGGVLLYLSFDLRTSWKQFSESSTSRATTLAELHRAVGYGGFVHNFKNYVLRGDQERLRTLNADLSRLFALLDIYSQYELKASEKEALTVIRQTFSHYQANILLAQRGRKENLTVVAIDQLVKVDDGPALKALAVLELNNQRHNQSQSGEINEQVNLLINTLLLGLLAMPFVILAAYHYNDLLRRMLALAHEKQKVSQTLEYTRQEAEQARLRSQEMEHQAYHCDLTKILNRKAFAEQGQVLLERTAEQGKRVTLLFVDVDDFKQINDSFGHDVGDCVLVEVARRLTLALREDDMVARLGGDEFALIVRGNESCKARDKLAQRLLEVMNESYAHLAEGLEVSCSVGGAVFPDEGTNLESLIRVADQRMYRVKRSGKNGVYLQDESSEA